MPLSKVGFNVEGIEKITAPEFNITSNATKFVEDIPIKVNEYTKNFVGTAVMVALFFYLYYKLADSVETGYFRFSQIRSLTIASGMTGIVGGVMFTIGYFRQFYPVMFFLIIFMIGFVWVVKEEKI